MIDLSHETIEKITFEILKEQGQNANKKKEN